MINGMFELNKKNNMSKKYKIFCYPADITMQGYLDMYDNKEIDIPTFQREFVWTKKQASSLIESILLGLPVPNIFLYKESEDAKYKIIDGHQRIQSIIKFMKGKFHKYDDIDFKLSLQDTKRGYKSDYHNITFSKLPKEEQSEFKRSVLRAMIIQRVDKTDNDSEYQIFERLNTGGKKLTPMQIRMCIFDGKLLQAVNQLSEKEIWLKLFKEKKNTADTQDLIMDKISSGIHSDLILRIFALFDAYTKGFDDNYKAPMNKYVDKYCRTTKEKEEHKEESTKIDIKQCIDKISRLFVKSITQLCGIDEKIFFLSKDKLNKSVVDSLVVAFMIKNNENENFVTDNISLITFTQSERYVKSIQEDSGTSRSEIVKNRINSAYELLS
jgi:hypothetical protein